MDTTLKMNRNSRKETIKLLDAEWNGYGYTGRYQLTGESLFVPVNSIDYVIKHKPKKD